MSVSPDFDQYTLRELRDALQYIDAAKYPERVTRLNELISKRETEGDIQRVVHPSKRCQRIKRAIKAWRIVRWLDKTFVGRFYRYLAYHHWGMESKE